MTPQEVVDLFYTLVDDQPDIDLVYSLMDAAYTKRNDERMWRFLLKLDTSITHSPGNTWETEKTLPTDFAEAVKMFGGSSDNPYDEVPFEDILRWKSSPNKFAVDIGQSKMRLTGAPSSALTMYLWYKYFPTALTGLSDGQKTSATTIVWPTRFRKMLAYDMAAAHLGGVDADEITRQQVPYLNGEHRGLHGAMISWNNKLALRAMGGAATQQRSVPGDRPDVVDW